MGKKIRIELDGSVCTGHGRCFSLAPELFDSDDEGHGVAIVAEVSADQLELAQLAVDSCPEYAIRLVESE